MVIDLGIGTFDITITTIADGASPRVVNTTLAESVGLQSRKQFTWIVTPWELGINKNLVNRDQVSF